jgi:transposase
VLLYDLTSTYFEGEAQEVDKAQRGYSRDHRPDCKQIIIALIVTPEGFPLSYEVFAGNRAEVTTLEEMLDAMERKHGRARRVWVFDRGIVSEENLQSLRRAGANYLVGTPARSSKLTSADCWRAIGKKSPAKSRSNSLPRIKRPTC